MMTFSMTFTEP